MDKQGTFEMLIVFLVMFGCGLIVVDKGQPESTRTQAFSTIAVLIGVIAPSPIDRNIKRDNKKLEEEKKENEKSDNN